MIVQNCIGYRFYSSSLLLVYDGLEADRKLDHICGNPTHIDLEKRLKKSELNMNKLDIDDHLELSESAKAVDCC